MESRVVVIPDPTTVVVTQYVPANNTQDVDSAALPPVSTAPAIDSPPPNEAPVADGDSPQFASFIPPTSQEISSVPTPTPAPGQELPPTKAPVNDGDAPEFASFIAPTSQEVTPVPTTEPGQVPGQVPGQEPEPASPAPSPETTSPIEPIPQPTSQEVPQETTPPIEPIAQPTSQQAPQETTESTRSTEGPDPVTTDAQLPAQSPVQPPAESIVQPPSQGAPQRAPEDDRLVNGPDPVTTDAQNPAQPLPQSTTEQKSRETPENARLIDGPDPVTTDAPNPAQPSAQPPLQGGPGNTPENARLIIETESESGSSLSLSATLTSEVLQFDTASFTYTGPPTRSTTLQTRRGTSTDESIADSTQSSDSFDADDGETGIGGGSEPQYTTATLADGIVTTIDLGATAGSGQSTESPDAAVKDKSNDDAGATPVVVGSVVGSILGISMLAFVIFWLMRRRKLQHRRSTLLTPLGTRPGVPPPSNLMKYEIDNQSLGPTPRSAKVAAAMSANAKKFSQRLRQSMSDASHINMSRGNSQFGADSQTMSTARAHSRASSTPGQQPQNGWWGQLIEESSVKDVPVAAPAMPHQGYDGRRTPSPNPFSDYNSTVAGPSGPPGLVREYSHSVPPHGSMVPPPLIPARVPGDDPFADGDGDSIMSPELAQQSPTVYGGAVGQRRSPSMSRNLTPQSTGDNINLKPHEVWRGKVHSNPFDLELDNRVVPSMYGNVQQVPSMYGDIQQVPSVYGNIQQVPRYTVASSFYSTANTN
ncbi:hypothetical protein ACLX1H_009904 [Fusarium chlamydosporum]